MTLTDHIYHALGIASQLAIVGAGVASIEVIRRTCAGQWARMWRIGSGQVVSTLYPVASPARHQRIPTPAPTLTAEEARGQGNREVRV